MVSTYKVSTQLCDNAVKMHTLNSVMAIIMGDCGSLSSLYEQLAFEVLPENDQYADEQEQPEYTW